MKKYSSQRLLLTNEELLRIQFLAKNSYRPSSKQRIKEKPLLEKYQFKPEINKQSANLQRSINDLLRWNLNKQMKRQQIYDDEVLNPHLFLVKRISQQCQQINS
ncbi:unnamed protein product (macronuclear) [Paramecium tetraurelia]|uniref:Homeobox domain-containing protein n=1 Tax=Paramecium tetraurelia TaxID=5888 RepID=A0E3M2_PARTE|nr:uncharacterized protein GSPATT00023062001 [Paramecium tetraurelia]CAK89889.1 unnamed protein product [Paramecium tetraurelia]|eukprot:XP_001457286.1 hypothetical protein (macronuclear) [Paramecium tetraurelia strain d4-2]